jgi:hypothetical protein
MKKCLMMCGVLLLAVVAKADPEFIKTLPKEDFAGAGLQKLTPEELARLETLVQRYKSGEVAVVRQQAEAQVTVTQQEAEKKVIAAETKALAAETKAKEAAAQADAIVAKAKETETKAAPAPAKKQPSWFTALITLKRAGEKPEKEQPLESRLVGDFRGWSGKTVFTLENGTRWAQQNPGESYPYAPTLHGPKVKITPASIHGFWLAIEGVNLNVRVVPVELPPQK